MQFWRTCGARKYFYFSDILYTVLEEQDVEGDGQIYRLRFPKNTNHMFVVRLLSVRITLNLRRFYSFITIGITLVQE
jgi:hypothetical protein